MPCMDGDYEKGTLRLRVPKEKAGEYSLGMKVKLTTKAKVVEVSQLYIEDKGYAEVTLEYYQEEAEVAKVDSMAEEVNNLMG